MAAKAWSYSMGFLEITDAICSQWKEVIATRGQENRGANGRRQPDH